MEVIGALKESLLKGSNSTLIRCILQLLQNEENWLIEYVPRNENRKANSITKLAFSREEEIEANSNDVAISTIGCHDTEAPKIHKFAIVLSVATPKPECRNTAA
ncbi:hypothetical protein Goari_018520 [Gossypium aridum]|uniref:RNase H type-1 domain-containing protein n=1 Tax=Gossypium aridum TaxID=34290 RepID=A0A7J8WPZ9_GOSAI|nr:hypothetical protein [Gossypium aridum]